MTNYQTGDSVWFLDYHTGKKVHGTIADLYLCCGERCALIEDATGTRHRKTCDRLNREKIAAVGPDGKKYTRFPSSGSRAKAETTAAR